VFTPNPMKKHNRPCGEGLWVESRVIAKKVRGKGKLEMVNEILQEAEATGGSRQTGGEEMGLSGF